MIEEKVVALCINETFKPKSDGDKEKYEIIRGIWKVPYGRLSRAQYAFGVYYGIVIEVYKIKYWQFATRYSDRLQKYWGTIESRFEFIGEVDKEMSAKYKGMDISHEMGNSVDFKLNPVRFINC